MQNVLCWMIKDQLNEPEGWRFYTPAKSEKKQKPDSLFSVALNLEKLELQSLKTDKSRRLVLGNCLSTQWIFQKIWLALILPPNCSLLKERAGYLLKFYNYWTYTWQQAFDSSTFSQCCLWFAIGREFQWAFSFYTNSSATNYENNFFWKVTHIFCDFILLPLNGNRPFFSHFFKA